MNTDHINYQQHLTNSIEDEETEKRENEILKKRTSSSHSMDNIPPDQSSILLNNEYEKKPEDPEDYLKLLTPVERRERLLTLLVMAFISLLTGIDYAIILPTAWGYIQSFMTNHFGGLVIGIFLSVFSLSGAISGIILGYLNDIGISLKALVMFGVGFKIIGNLLYFIGINIYVVIIARLIAGVGMGFVPPLLAELSRRSTPQTRTQLFAKILGCRQVGLFLGPCFTIVFKQLNFDFIGVHVTMYNAPGLLMALLWIITAILVICFFYDIPKTTEENISVSNRLNAYAMREALKQIPALCKKPVIIVLLITSFIAYFNQTALETTLTPFTNFQFNWTELQVSILFAVAGVEITIVYIVIHFITHKVRDQSTLLVAYIILSIALLIGVIVLPLSEVGSKQFLPAFLVFVGLDILALPLIVVTSTSLFTQQTSDDQQGMGQGIQRFVISIAVVVGPLYAGGLLKNIWLMLLIMLIMVIISTVLIMVVFRSFHSKKNDETSALISAESK